MCKRIKPPISGLSYPSTLGSMAEPNAWHGAPADHPRTPSEDSNLANKMNRKFGVYLEGNQREPTSYFADILIKC